MRGTPEGSSLPDFYVPDSMQTLALSIDHDPGLVVVAADVPLK